jgi:hypothetical protein
MLLPLRLRWCQHWHKKPLRLLIGSPRTSVAAAWRCPSARLPVPLRLCPPSCCSPAATSASCRSSRAAAAAGSRPVGQLQPGHWHNRSGRGCSGSATGIESVTRHSSSSFTPRWRASTQVLQRSKSRPAIVIKSLARQGCSGVSGAGNFRRLV